MISQNSYYNITGDSRTSLGYRNAQGGITAVSLTIDHKPDLPAEKVHK